MTHYTRDGLPVYVHDTITADQDISAGDQVFIFAANDPLEVKETLDEGDTIMIRGYSHESGDMVTYFLRYDEEVGLWSA